MKKYIAILGLVSLNLCGQTIGQPTGGQTVQVTGTGSGGSGGPTNGLTAAQIQAALSQSNYVNQPYLSSSNYPAGTYTNVTVTYYLTNGIWITNAGDANANGMYWLSVSNYYWAGQEIVMSFTNPVHTTYGIVFEPNGFYGYTYLYELTNGSGAVYGVNQPGPFGAFTNALGQAFPYPHVDGGTSPAGNWSWIRTTNTQSFSGFYNPQDTNVMVCDPLNGSGLFYLPGIASSFPARYPSDATAYPGIKTILLKPGNYDDIFGHRYFGRMSLTNQIMAAINGLGSVTMQNGSFEVNNSSVSGIILFGSGNDGGALGAFIVGGAGVTNYLSDIITYGWDDGIFNTDAGSLNAKNCEFNAHWVTYIDVANQNALLQNCYFNLTYNTNITSPPVDERAMDISGNVTMIGGGINVSNGWAGVYECDGIVAENGSHIKLYEVPISIGNTNGTSTNIFYVAGCSVTFPTTFGRYSGDGGGLTNLTGSGIAVSGGVGVNTTLTNLTLYPPLAGNEPLSVEDFSGVPIIIVSNRDVRLQNLTPLGGTNLLAVTVGGIMTTQIMANVTGLNLGNQGYMFVRGTWDLMAYGAGKLVTNFYTPNTVYTNSNQGILDTNPQAGTNEIPVVRPGGYLTNLTIAGVANSKQSVGIYTNGILAFWINTAASGAAYAGPLGTNDVWCFATYGSSIQTSTNYITASIEMTSPTP